MRPIDIKVLPGEPTDGTGKIRIHWFVRDDAGPAETPGASGPLARMPVGHPMRPGVRGYLACQKNRGDVGPRGVGGAIVLTPHSDDVRGANCPECLATDEAKAMLVKLGEVVPAPAYPAKQEG